MRRVTAWSCAALALLVCPAPEPSLGPGLLGGGIARAAKGRSKDKADGADKEKAAKDEARQLFEKGLRLYDLRKFDQAIELFERAYQVLPQPAFLYNIAQAHRQAGRRDEAVAFYQSYLRRLPDAQNREEVEDWLRTLAREKEQAKPPQQQVSRTVTPPPPQPYPEPRTKHDFLTHLRLGGRDYTLVGVGSRSYLGFLVYGMGLYVEDEPARKSFPRLVAQAGGTDLSHLSTMDLAHSFIMRGEFGKAAVLYYARDVSAQKIRDSYRDMLKDNLSQKAPVALRQHTEQFINLFDRDMKAREEMLILTTREGAISISVGGDYKRTGPTDPRLEMDLWACWLGPKPVSSELKQDLIRRLPALGQ